MPNMKTVSTLFRLFVVVSVMLLCIAQLFLVEEVIESTIQPSPEPAPTLVKIQPILPVALMAESLAIRKTHRDRIRFDQSVFQNGHETQFPLAKRGIVMCLHGGIAALGISFIQELRRWNNSLPIQIYHCLPEELSPSTREAIVSSDQLQQVEIIDVCSHLINNQYLNQSVAKEYQSYYIKILAVLHTSFDEVMLVDADDIFLHDPDILWTNPGYNDTGTLFFYDRQINANQYLNKRTQNKTRTLHDLHANFPYALFGLERPKVTKQLSSSRAWQGLTAHEQDSSVVLFHKSKLNPVVFEIMWYLVHFTRIHTPYKAKNLSWGDKEYFWLSCVLAGVPYNFSPHPVAVIEKPGDLKKQNKTLCGSLAQYTPLNGTNVSLLYMNARAVITPKQVKNQTQINWKAQEERLIKQMPHHVTPLQQKRHFDSNRRGFGSLCLVNQGAVPIQEPHYQDILRQRIHDTIAAAKRLRK